MPQDHWLSGFAFNVEEWDAEGELSDAGDLPHARLGPHTFQIAIDEKPSGRFMIRSRTGW